MAQTNKIFAVHPGEILKTEFMEPMGVRPPSSGSICRTITTCGLPKAAALERRSSRARHRRQERLALASRPLRDSTIQKLLPGAAVRRSRSEEVTIYESEDI